MASYKERWAEYFDILDADGSGFIDPNDSSNFVKRLASYLPPSELPKIGQRHGDLFRKLLKEYDANKDGKISKDELLAAVEKVFVGKTVDTAPAWWREHTAETFALMDYKKIGEILVEDIIVTFKILSPTETEENIRNAYTWVTISSKSGKYDQVAYVDLVFGWASSRSSTPQATVLLPLFRKPH